MTTKFSTIKFALLTFYCHGVSQEKQRFGGRFSSLAPRPPPPPKKNAFFSVVVSPSLIFVETLRKYLLKQAQFWHV